MKPLPPLKRKRRRRRKTPRVTVSTRRMVATLGAWTLILVGLSRYVAWDRFRGRVDLVTELEFFTVMALVTLLLLALFAALCWALLLTLAEWRRGGSR